MIDPMDRIRPILDCPRCTRAQKERALAHASAYLESYVEDAAYTWVEDAIDNRAQFDAAEEYISANPETFTDPEFEYMDHGAVTIARDWDADWLDDVNQLLITYPLGHCWENRAPEIHYGKCPYCHDTKLDNPHPPRALKLARLARTALTRVGWRVYGAALYWPGWVCKLAHALDAVLSWTCPLCQGTGSIDRLAGYVWDETVEGALGVADLFLYSAYADGYQYGARARECIAARVDVPAEGD